MSWVTFALLSAFLIFGRVPSNEAVVAFDDRIRGFWMTPHGGVDYLDSRAADELATLHGAGARWIAYGPTIDMPDHEKPELSWDRDGNRDRAVIRRFRAAGFNVMVVPRIEAPSFFTGDAQRPWRGAIEMRTPADWAAFHANLADATDHFATLSQEEGVGIYSLGLEYHLSTSKFPEAWRHIAARARERFHGLLTYGANWRNEIEDVRFWDALDCIGVCGYFPVAEQDSAGVDEMVRGWAPWRERLAQISRACNRPVLFVEIGYTATSRAGRRPWDWYDLDVVHDPRHQADCFRAFFRAFEGVDFSSGWFIWQWHTNSRTPADWEYIPSHRPAREVVFEQLGKG